MNMFPSIPLQLIQNNIHLHWKEIKKHTSLNKKSFISLLEFIYNNSYVNYKNRTYKQNSGIFMGSGLSPIITTRVIYNLLTSVITELDFDILFIKTFVDDSIIALPKNKIMERLTN